MKITSIFAITVLALALNANAAPTDIVLIGHFSNEKIEGGDDPHIVSGYGLDIYKKDKVVFGRISMANGSGEPTGAPLYDINLDEEKKIISFKAKLSPDREFSKETGPEGRDSRVLLEFKGTITKKSISGKFYQKDGYHLSENGTSFNATMKHTNEKHLPSNYDEWLQYESGVKPNW